MSVRQLWEIALEARQLEQRQALVEDWRGRQIRRGVGTRMAARKYPPAKVGDVFGAMRVVDILPRDHTSNERVLVSCKHGHQRPAYVFNLRQKPPRKCVMCRRIARELRTTEFAK